MDVTKPRATLSRKTILLPIIGIVAFFLYVLIFNVDIIQIIETAKKADPLLYSAAVLMGFAEVFFSAVSWRAILSSLKVKISIIRSNLYTWYGIFLDIVIPAESITGELCRIYLVNREHSGTSGKTVASVVTQRILGMGINVVMLVLGIGFLFNTSNMRPEVFAIIVFFTVAVAALMIILMLVSLKESWSKRIIDGLIRIINYVTRNKWKQRLVTIKEETIKATKIFHDSMKEFGRNPKTLILPTLLLFLNFVSGLAVPYLVFLSLGNPVDWTIILITNSIVIAVKSIPVGIPFEVGLPEITMFSVYHGFGVTEAIAGTATILTRLITLWLRAVVGFSAQQWVELKMVFSQKNNLHSAKV
jgi:uncharacterized protein (TIRG00374 family)